jgi:hypothetical protein
MTHFARIAVVLVLAAFAGLFTVHGAQAATRTASISVSAEVVDTCSVSVSGMANAVAARCSLATPYQVVMGSAASATADAVVSTKSSSVQANAQNAASGVLMTIIF